MKKRYAVFNFDGSLAELKGFEVKRRGELQLIKIFQASVFESFLKGNTLEECYASVAKDADYWLDLLYSKCENMPDSELFELISENKSMSRKLEEYGAQKSTSISTAKRLAEFLGDEMVKDAGLACRYIIANKPQSAPVTERAIPLAIFQSEPAVRRHHLKKWLKDPTLYSDNIRDILDWNYYIERLGSAIQKIITIPAAMQGLPNPVPRVQHPPWLHKKVTEKSASHRQKKITDIFTVSVKESTDTTEEPRDIEDLAGPSTSFKNSSVSIVNKRKRLHSDEDEAVRAKSWKEALGSPPPMGKTREEMLKWLEFHKKKWAFQAKQRHQHRQKRSKTSDNDKVGWGVIRNANTSTMTGFLRRAQRKLLETPWQIVQLSETGEPGMFRLWILVDTQLHQVRLVVPRIFYVNTRKARPDPGPNELWKKSFKSLPRSRPVYNLYRYALPESLFQKHSRELLEDLSKPEIEGIYETQMSLEFRAILQLGCVCIVDPRAARKMADGADTFTLDQLEYKSIAFHPYLKQPEAINYIFLYHHWSSNHQRALWGLFLSASKKTHVFVLDSVATNQLPNMSTLYTQERKTTLEKSGEDKINRLPKTMQFTMQVETSFQQVCRILQSILTTYKNEGHGATIIINQTAIDKTTLITEMPLLNEFPLINTQVRDVENLYGTLEWQKIGARMMIRHYLKSQQIVELMAEQCRFFHAPIGNIPADPTLFGTDLFYARHLYRNNFVLWCSPTEKPDLGGSENDDNRLLTDFEESSSCAANNSGSYSSVCVQLDVESLAVNALLQYHHIHDVDGTSTFVAFHNQQRPSVQDMATGNDATIIPSYDEITLCNPAFKTLRSMVNAWILDVSMYKNVFADYQLIHFYRWLRSPSALLYDPALRRTLHTYMKKLYIQLIAEFKTLGCIIVFANFNKIIVCTKKRSVGDALGYIEFVVQTIRNKELFHGIEITFDQCWEYLIWHDLHNHAGIKGKIRDANDTEDQESVENDDDEPEIIMNWSLMECLPDEVGCRSSFSTVIAGYINAVYQCMMENEANNTLRPRRRLSQSSFALGLGALENTADYAKKLISGEMSQRLFKIVQKIHRNLPEKILTLEDYPNLDMGGKEMIKINPALELIKAICKVLSLDKEMEHEVYNLKANLLRLIGVGSFSDNVEWKDPCISFILPEVICKACNHTRDIDLCKDQHCTIENNTHLWKCPICDTSYDNTEIEFSLIDKLNRKSMGYVLQDQQCRKCKEIKRDNMNILCPCSGEYANLISRNEITKLVNICKSVAKKCKMNILSEIVDNAKLIIS